MRRTFEYSTKARLSFSGGPHAPANMSDSMENAGSWTVSGSKKAMEVLKNLQKLGVRNIAQYSAANVPFPAFFPPTFTSSILSAMFTGACGPPEKLSLALVLRSCVLRMIVKMAYRPFAAACKGHITSHPNTLILGTL